ncbi:acid-soluble spore protein N [Bacillus sp. REN10]
MGNPKRNSKDFTPNQLGTQPRAAGGNKGKKMQDKSGKQPDVINGS